MEELSNDELESRKQWFENYVNQLENHSVIKKPQSRGLYRCPCCLYKTLKERGGYEICPVCFWEDDGQDDQDADVIRGGPNGKLTLTQARENFKKFGASTAENIKFTRTPNPDEI